jgi:hypothetical protein
MDFIHFPDPALLTLEPEKQFALFLGFFYRNTSAAKIRDIKNICRWSWAWFFIVSFVNFGRPKLFQRLTTDIVVSSMVEGVFRIEDFQDNQPMTKKNKLSEVPKIKTKPVFAGLKKWLGHLPADGKTSQQLLDELRGRTT